MENESNHPPTEPLAPPRLGIIHLLGWTTITAVSLALLQNLASERDSSDPFELFNRIWYAIMLGVSLGAVLLMVVRRCRGIAFPTQPGEWSLVAGGIGSIIHLVCWALYNEFFGPRSYAGVWLFYLGYWMSLAPDYWAARNVEPRAWQRLFWARFGFNLVEALLISTRFDSGGLNLYWTITAIDVLVCLLWLVRLWNADRSAGIQRGWLHNLGLVCWVLSVIHMATWWAWVFIVGLR